VLKVYSIFFFVEFIMTSIAYHEMMIEWLLLQLAQDRNNFILQQAGGCDAFSCAGVTVYG
jgi:hypothetical protein